MQCSVKKFVSTEETHVFIFMFEFQLAKFLLFMFVLSNKFSKN